MNPFDQHQITARREQNQTSMSDPTSSHPQSAPRASRTTSNKAKDNSNDESHPGITICWAERLRRYAKRQLRKSVSDSERRVTSC
jgi:hypothetical protein